MVTVPIETINGRFYRLLFKCFTKCFRYRIKEWIDEGLKGFALRWIGVGVDEI